MCLCLCVHLCPRWGPLKAGMGAMLVQEAAMLGSPRLWLDSLHLTYSGPFLGREWLRENRAVPPYPVLERIGAGTFESG